MYLYCLIAVHAVPKHFNTYPPTPNSCNFLETRCGDVVRVSFEIEAGTPLHSIFPMVKGMTRYGSARGSSYLPTSFACPNSRGTQCNFFSQNVYHFIKIKFVVRLPLKFIPNPGHAPSFPYLTLPGHMTFNNGKVPWKEEEGTTDSFLLAWHPGIHSLTFIS